MAETGDLSNNRCSNSKEMDCNTKSWEPLTPDEIVATNILGPLIKKRFKNFLNEEIL